jgi:uncharacterized protein (DUF302 family)
MNDVPLMAVLHDDFERAVSRTTEALKREGFGVLTEVDVQRTLKEKVGAALPPYRILGACNPPFALQAVTANPDAGLMMPCNVVVRAGADGGVTVRAVDPVVMAQAFGDPRLVALAHDVRAKLAAALAALR